VQRRRKAANTVRLLRRTYGTPRHGNPDDPLDDLIFVILSQMTTGPSYERVFGRLKRIRGGWRRVARMREPTLRALIADAGLSRQKAPRLLAILRRLNGDFGSPTLRSLEGLSDRAAEAYLTSLPGVGPKTAKCVLMYTLGRHALPVDTHLDRLAARIGLVDSGLTRARRHAELERTVAPPDRYALHVGALAHGRAVCRSLRPRCGACVLAELCLHRSRTPQPD
jgi:endonuclease III